jgi:ankyrin repeat protein
MICRYNQLDMLKYVLDDLKVPLEKHTLDGECALHCAAMGDAEDVLRFLIALRKPPLVDIPALSLPSTPLSRDPAPIKLSAVIPDMPKIFAVDAATKFGDTALHHAARSGSLRAIAVLVESGADVNAKNELGETPLHKAAMFAEVQAADMLAAAGADLEVETASGEKFPAMVGRCLLPKTKRVKGKIVQAAGIVPVNDFTLVKNAIMSFHEIYNDKRYRKIAAEEEERNRNCGLGSMPTADDICSIS